VKRLLLATVLLLAGCLPFSDGDQYRLCRQILPAINGEGATLQILRHGPWENRGIRIDYRVQDSQGPERGRALICQFAASTLEANRLDLRRLIVDGDEMSGSEIFMLKRFWLETPDAELADPGAAADLSVASRRLVSRGTAVALQHLISSLPSMAIYALLASAYALIYGLIGRINLAFGEFAALGGISAGIGITLSLQFGQTSVALVLAAATGLALFAAVLHAYVASRLILQPLAGRPGQHVLVATIGLAIALQEYMRLTQGNGTRWVPPIFNTPVVVARSDDFLVTLTPIALAVTVAAFCAALALLYVLKFSRFGRQWRAVADDPLAAELFGVSPAAVYAETFALACGLAGFAGLIVTVYYGGIGFAGGAGLGLKALVGAVAGGIGSVPGAMLGGLLVGLVEASWSALLPIVHRDVALYTLLIVLLALKPGGLFGFGGLLPRRV